MSSKFEYTRAIVCGIPSSLPAQAQRLEEPGEGVDLLKARKQHAEYVSTLKKLGLEVTEMTPDENCPDCVFVEDTAVCVDNSALIPILGHQSRRPEASRMKDTLEGLGFNVIEMQDPAILDGGDVLFTGREFFVGVSTRSNMEGVAELAKAFPEYPVNSIKVVEHLHLKSMMTMGGPDVIFVGASKVASDAWNELESKAKFKYQKLVLPEDHAANCLYLNGTLVHLAPHEIPESISVYRKLPGPKIELENSELHKVDGCLTCNSILLC
ncbi:N(G),N(G)-dimethylarginine dimethylaminohydrolase 1-like [Actinia tenebrosa]|uniref:N(G),N(G)-dimethylarginine dimethylaminohydrolase 1-like n=1 Tax=Actinia tenebrosa TaxID=6105 RepID=A0A6P8I8P1_ACTTE|nr:N(G),N(G)-dimethylarginine dimethylaminohydrolase 1-like [Actinia tenebrosa]